MVLVSAAAADAADAAPVKPSPSAFLDTPAWPTGAKPALELTFKLSPARVDPKDPDPYPADYPHVPVELVATIGGVSRHVSLSPSFGSVKPYNQAVCQPANDGAYALGKREVAKVTFYEGGAGGYLVRRTATDGVLEIVKWSQGDGACPGPNGPTACAPALTRVLGLHVPADAVITQRIVEVAADGSEKDLDCHAK